MILKKYIAAAMLMYAAGAHAQDHTATDAAVNRFQTLFNADKGGDIFGMLSDRIKKLLPEDKTIETMSQMHKQYGDFKEYTFLKEEQGLSYYNAGFAGGTLTLVTSLDKEQKLETFRFLPAQAANPSEKSDFDYRGGKGHLYGSFSIPDGDKPVPVVLIIAGSGPTDRNGNQEGTVKANTYKLIADSLKKAGIASLRYDKRGTGESAAALRDESAMRFGDIVDDAAGIIAELKQDKRFSSVIVLGHSEGSLVGMMAAAKEPVAAYISVAGLANSADKILVRQIAAQSEELSLRAAFLLDSIKNGKQITDPGDELSTLFRPSVQPYLKSWINIDPQNEIKRLNIPVLIVQGTTDIQVSEGEAITLQEAYPRASLKIIKGMNHVLKSAPEDRTRNIATYSIPDLPLAPGLVPTLTGFIKTIK